MTVFYLVRHGATAQTNTRLTGWTPGVPLSPTGVQQAEDVATDLSSVRFRAIYSSPIERTIQTARIIAKPHGIKVAARKGLGEVDYGTWTGRRYGALMKTKLWARVQRTPSLARFPEGESLREVQARVLSELERIRSDHPKGNVCIVTHADVIRLVLAHYLGVHLDLYQRVHVGIASTSVVGVGDDGVMVLSVNRPARSHRGEG